MEWEAPQDLKGVRSFLGFANYYRRFVQGYAELASPLTYLTKKDVPWVWGPPQRQAFQRLKQALCNAPLLQYPNPSKPYVVVTDASGLAAGGVLMQDQGQGLRPLAFMSRALKPTEQQYSAYERELAAIAYCFIQWRHYLEGCPGGVTVMTDHKPLTLLMDQQVLSRSQTRWIRLGLFQSIQPKITYQPGKANIVTDALSRSRPQFQAQSKEQDKIQQQHRLHLAEGQETEDSGFLFATTLSTGVEKAQFKTVQEAQKADPVLTTYIKLPKAELTRRGMQVSPQGILYKVVDSEQLMMVPHELRQKILVENHDVPTAGHVGINRTVDLIKRNYWWRGIWGDVAAYVWSCPVCQRMKSDNRKKAGEMQPIPLPERAWQ